MLLKNNHLNPFKSFKDGYFLLSFLKAEIHTPTIVTINRLIPIIVCMIS
nr:hypothetical protein [uncultured Gemella sp.]